MNFQTNQLEQGNQASFGNFDGKNSFKQDKQQCLFYPWLVDQLSINDQNFGCTDRECEKFSKQLRSIDFKNATHLPDQACLQSCFQEINQSRNKAQTRRDLVKQLIDKGCTITDQDAKHRPVNETEKKTLTDEIQSLTPTFENNKAALKQFIEKRVAVQSDVADQSASLKNLADAFKKVDNKPYYDDLGQLIGALSEALKPGEIISVSCLTTLISMFQPDQPTKHYPVDLLQTLIETYPHPGLTSKSFGGLEDQLQGIDQDQLKGIAANDYLPHDAKKKLIKEFLNPKFALINTNVSIEFGGDQDQQIVDVEKITKIKLETINNAVYPSRTSENVKALLTSKKHQLGDKYTEILQQKDARIVSAYTEWLINQVPNRSDKSVGTVLGHVLSATSEDQADVHLLWLESLTTSELGFGEAVQKLVIDFEIPEVKKRGPISTILIRALRAGKSPEDSVLNEHTQDQLKSLKSYLEKINDLDPIITLLKKDDGPSLKQWNRIIENFDLLGDQNNSGQEAVDYFDKTIRTTDETGKTLRSLYSDDKDIKNIERVLASFRTKGDAVISDDDKKLIIYSLAATNQLHGQLRLEFKTTDDLTQLLQVSGGKANTLEGKAQVLAIMREILLRKTGKWVNRTQMIDLLYAAINDDKGMIHELKTGQGKSIISAMRAGYLAVTGKIVDVFSAKESLSARDYEEWKGVIEAFGVECGYIEPNSPQDAYKVGSGGVGAVNYATIGNWSLWYSKCLDEDGSCNIGDKQNKIAWLDEADHIIRDERTMYNYAAPTESSSSVYNLEAWVYSEVWDFYQDKKNQIFENTEQGKITSYHIELLCKQIQEKAKFAPNGSTFIEDFLTPCLDQDSKKALVASERRDLEFVSLINAAITAETLKVNQDFTESKEIRVIQGSPIETRFATVINNQKMVGSTYSERVQQMLHVRLNHEASNNGKRPNYFIETESKVAMSRLAQDILREHYKQVEGCTGTTGNPDTLKVYEGCGVQSVIKLPTNEPILSKYLGMDLCNNQNAQVDKIVDYIKQYGADRPILITCANDEMVKTLHQAVKDRLGESQFDLYADTNDSGEHENDVVPLSGACGRVTFSARMGRGTDIKPKGNHGLMVMRTYPADPRVVKQEAGRQGRNGNPGTIVDVYNYEPINKLANSLVQDNQIDSSSNTTDQKVWQTIYKQEKEHLEEKLSKQKADGKMEPKAQTILNVAKVQVNDNHLEQNGHGYNLNHPKVTQYLNMRTYVRFLEAKKNQKNRYTQGKEQLLSVMSGYYQDALSQKNGPVDESFKHNWMDVIAAVDTAWVNRLGEKDPDTNKAYDTFYKAVDNAWQQFKSKSYINSEALSDQSPLRKNESNTLDAGKISASPAINPPSQYLHSFIELNMAVAQASCDHHFSTKQLPQGVEEAIYKTNEGGSVGIGYLVNIFDQWQTDSEQMPEPVFKAFSALEKQKVFSHLPFDARSEIWRAWDKKIKSDESYKQHLEGFSACVTALSGDETWQDYQPKTSQKGDIEKYQQLIIGASQFCLLLPQKHHQALGDCISGLTKVARHHYFDQQDTFYTRVGQLFGADQLASKLLIQSTKYEDLKPLIDLLMAVKEEDLAKRIKKLTSYVKKHQAHFEANPTIIVPAALVALRDDTDMSDIYNIDSYKQGKSWLIYPAIERCIWQILAHHPYQDPIVPIKWIANLDQRPNLDGLEQVLELPPHLPLEMVFQACQTAGKSKQGQLGMTDFGQNLYGCLVRGELVQHKDLYSVPKDLIKYNDVTKKIVDSISNNHNAMFSGSEFSELFTRVPHKSQIESGDFIYPGNIESKVSDEFKSVKALIETAKQVTTFDALSSSIKSNIQQAWQKGVIHNKEGLKQVCQVNADFSQLTKSQMQEIVDLKDLSQATNEQLIFLQYANHGLLFASEKDDMAKILKAIELDDMKLQDPVRIDQGFMKNYQKIDNLRAICHLPNEIKSGNRCILETHKQAIKKHYASYHNPKNLNSDAIQASASQFDSIVNPFSFDENVKLILKAAWQRGVIQNEVDLKQVCRVNAKFSQLTEDRKQAIVSLEDISQDTNEQLIFLQYANHGLLFAANKFDSVLEDLKNAIKSEEIEPSRFSWNEKYAQHRSQVSKWNFINTAPIVGCKKINQQEISDPYNKKTFQVKRWGSSSCFMISALIQVFAGCLISGHLPYALSNVLPANPYLFGVILGVSLIFVVIGICLYYLGQKQHQVLIPNPITK